MERYAVKPIFTDIEKSRRFHLEIDAPGSKSITNRALMLAALGDGTTVLHGTLFSDDSRHFLGCLEALGFSVRVDAANHTVTVKGHGGRIPNEKASIYVGSAGTAARFLTAMLGFAKGTYHLDASPQMRKRPMAPLIATLRSIGCEVTCEEKEGFFPFTIHSDGITARSCRIVINDSSQFLSALLMSAVMLDHDFDIELVGSHGFSYIVMTMRMMEQFGVNVTCTDQHHFHLDGSAAYKACSYQIEPDVSAASYFYGMAAISGGSVLVRHVHFDSLQGDVAFLRALEQMGCRAVDTSMGILLQGPENGLKGIDLDMSAFSDQALTVGAIAPFANAPVRICKVGHIRLQESDRMVAIVSNLKRMGIEAEIDGDDIIIYPGNPQPAEIETFDDHRVAMAFSLTGLKSKGIVILDPLCCRKTFEEYFTVLDGIIADFTS